MTEVSPYLVGPHTPVEQEIDTELEVTFGQVPPDLSGLYVRNGPNPRFTPPGRYHWFDGDGMVHAVHIESGKLNYKNRWIQTRALTEECDADQALYGGVMEPVRKMAPTGPYKDTANTDVLWFGGELVTLWYVSGEPYRLNGQTLETEGRHDFGGKRPGMVSAHAKVDPRTQEMLWFNYGFKPPYMTYGVVSPDGQLAHHTAIDLPGARLPHDMAHTENYAVLMDLPLFYDPDALAAGRWVTRYHSHLPARFGVLPRRADGTAIRWFDADPCYIYHVVNAWEEGQEIVLIACQVDDPLPTPDPAHGRWAKMMANLKVVAHLHRWRFNLETGAVKEEPLDDLTVEFPMINHAYQGTKNRYGYCSGLAADPTVRFTGLVKYDLESGHREQFIFPPSTYGSEAPFAPRRNAQREDDGYLTSFVHDAETQRSELWIFDAQDLSRGPVCKARIPQPVPPGFHATWVPGNLLNAARPGLSSSRAMPSKA